MKAVLIPLHKNEWIWLLPRGSHVAIIDGHCVSGPVLDS